MASLRAVQPGEEAPQPPVKKSVTEAADSGTHLELLVALRTRLALAVADETCPPRDLAALTRRLQDIAKEIETLRARAAEEERESAGVADEAWDQEAL